MVKNPQRSQTNEVANSELPSRQAPLPIAVLNQKISAWINRLGTVWVEGEITQWQERGGHIYGKLRDLNDNAAINFTIWRNIAAKLGGKFAPGDHVAALVKVDFWQVGGSLTLQVQKLAHVGIGELLERLEKLRAQLASEGLFSPERKRPLPFLPQLVGLITGRDSDAEQDVLKNARLRWPEVQFKVRYAAVQGERAAREVSAAIAELDADPQVEVIIVARGGGDMLNLLPFSDEQVVRAAARANTPLVSAIGHEADRPLLDEVADLRASTPTDAAKRVVPDIDEERTLIESARSRSTNRMRQLVSHESERISQLRERPVLRDPQHSIAERALDLQRWVMRGAELIDREIAQRDNHLLADRQRLKALSPLATLKRGYAIAQLSESGAVLQDAAAAPPRTQLNITLASGKVRATTI